MGDKSTLALYTNQMEGERLASFPRQKNKMGELGLGRRLIFTFSSESNKNGDGLGTLITYCWHKVDIRIPGYKCVCNKSESELLPSQVEYLWSCELLAVNKDYLGEPFLSSLNCSYQFSLWHCIQFSVWMSICCLGALANHKKFTNKWVWFGSYICTARSTKISSVSPKYSCIIKKKTFPGIGFGIWKVHNEKCVGAARVSVN